MSYKVGDVVHWHFLESKVDHLLDEGDHAVILDPQDDQVCDDPGCVTDIAQYWETTQNMVLNGGARAVVVGGSEQLFTGNHDDEQRMVDHWRELYADCWGVKP